ncbi:MAG: hypothetical protein H0T46_24995 [Deltaproteobacteria bacterium]|nr:hypothetical protein [Deltaproteobacteria bacterium]
MARPLKGFPRGRDIGALASRARRFFRPLGRALIVLLLIATAAHAEAPVGPEAIENFLTRGKKLFEEQEYAGAIQTLSPVTRDARATRAQRLRALELIALANFIRGDEGAARATFERILDIDPGYQLRDTSGSPKIRSFFEALKKQLIPNFDPNAGADLEHAAPTAGTAGKLVEIEARATRGGERVFELVVATRRRGELSYKVVTALPRGDARWRARITAAASSKPYVLEYYVEARDAGGAAVARIAAPDSPLEVALTAGGPDTAGKRAWYNHWYVYAGVAVVAAGVTGIAIAATRGPDDGSLPPGSVVLTP